MNWPQYVYTAGIVELTFSAPDGVRPGALSTIAAPKALRSAVTFAGSPAMCAVAWCLSCGSR